MDSVIDVQSSICFTQEVPPLLGCFSEGADVQMFCYRCMSTLEQHEGNKTLTISPLSSLLLQHWIFCT